MKMKKKKQGCTSTSRKKQVSKGTGSRGVNFTDPFTRLVDEKDHTAQKTTCPSKITGCRHTTLASYSLKLIKKRQNEKSGANALPSDDTIRVSTKRTFATDIILTETRGATY